MLDAVGATDRPGSRDTTTSRSDDPLTTAAAVLRTAPHLFRQRQVCSPLILTCSVDDGCASHSFSPAPSTTGVHLTHSHLFRRRQVCSSLILTCSVDDRCAALILTCSVDDRCASHPFSPVPSTRGVHLTHSHLFRRRQVFSVLTIRCTWIQRRR